MVSSDLRYVRYDGERLPSLFYGLSRSTDQVLYYEHLQSPFVAIRERSGTAKGEKLYYCFNRDRRPGFFERSWQKFRETLYAITVPSVSAQSCNGLTHSPWDCVPDGEQSCDDFVSSLCDTWTGSGSCVITAMCGCAYGNTDGYCEN